MEQLAKATCLIVLPVTFVLRPVRPQLYAPPVLFVILDISSVFGVASLWLVHDLLWGFMLSLCVCEGSIDCLGCALVQLDLVLFRSSLSVVFVCTVK